jgi:hypothetical protein
VTRIFLGGGSNIIGPSSAVINNIPIFSSSTGKVVIDSGSSVSSFIPVPSSPLAGDTLYYSGSLWTNLAADSGKYLKSLGTASPPVWATVTAGGSSGSHGMLDGLADDDHAQYILISTSRASDWLQSLRFNSGSLGFFGASVMGQSTGWDATSASTDKIFSASATTLDELANVLCTLINDLKNYGILGA